MAEVEQDGERLALARQIGEVVQQLAALGPEVLPLPTAQAQVLDPGAGIAQQLRRVPVRALYLTAHPDGGLTWYAMSPAGQLLTATQPFDPAQGGRPLVRPGPGVAGLPLSAGHGTGAPDAQHRRDRAIQAVLPQLPWTPWAPGQPLPPGLDLGGLLEAVDLVAGLASGGVPNTHESVVAGGRPDLRAVLARRPELAQLLTREEAVGRLPNATPEARRHLAAHLSALPLAPAPSRDGRSVAAKAEPRGAR